MSTALEQLIDLGDRKGTEISIFAFDAYGDNWSIEIKCQENGVTLKVSNTEFKDFYGAVTEVVEKFSRATSGLPDMRTRQLSHQPSPPNFSSVTDDEIPL